MIKEIKYNVTLDDIAPLLSAIERDYDIKFEKNNIGDYVCLLSPIGKTVLFVCRNTEKSAIIFYVVVGDTEDKDINLEIINNFNSSKCGGYSILLDNNKFIVSMKPIFVEYGVSEYYLYKELYRFIGIILYELIPYLQENGVIPNEE